MTAIRERYGYDFSHYARASFLRRVRHAMQEERLHGVSELQAKMLRDPLVHAAIFCPSVRARDLHVSRPGVLSGAASR